jgi:hypothetical protein
MTAIAITADNGPSCIGSEADPTAIRLSPLESLGASSFFAGDIRTAVEEVEQLASLLATLRGSAARRDLISKHLATTHVQVAALSALLGKLVAKKDVDGSRAVSRLLNDAVRRLAALAQAHADLTARARPSVVVGHATHVSVREGTP